MKRNNKKRVKETLTLAQGTLQELRKAAQGKTLKTDGPAIMKRFGTALNKQFSKESKALGKWVRNPKKELRQIFFRKNLRNAPASEAR